MEEGGIGAMTRSTRERMSVGVGLGASEGINGM